MIESGTIDRDAVNKRDAFSRIKNAMVEEKLIEERFGFVWPSQQPGGMFSNIPSPRLHSLILPPLPMPPSLLPPPQSAGSIDPCDDLRRTQVRPADGTQTRSFAEVSGLTPLWRCWSPGLSVLPASSILSLDRYTFAF
jgi:hypothetical protein